MPKVSVIIPTYNCAKYLPEAVESVLNQTFQDFEIIIVNDGSTDNTKQIIEPYLKKHSDKIKYLYQENMGLAIARNVAIKKSIGEYIAFLDADDVWLRHRLKETANILENMAQVGLVHANINWMSEEGKVLSFPYRNKARLSGFIFENIFLRKANISIPTILVRSKCFEKVGLFDEKLARLGCEDREMWLRISREYEIKYIDKILANYRIRPNSMSRNLDKMLQARYYVVDKFYPRGKFSLLKKRALSNIHNELGDDFLIKLNYFRAEKEYIKTIIYWPFSFRPWVNIIKAILKINIKTNKELKTT